MSVLYQISHALVVEDDVFLALQMQDFLTDLGCPKTVIFRMSENGHRTPAGQGHPCVEYGGAVCRA
jgi:hypothetical protein